MRQMNINKGNYEVKSHYKMYKAGKRWVVAGMATVSLLGGLLMLSTDASADNVDAVVPASESSVTAQVSTPTDSVVLDHASASVAPASSVNAEVSASSASSVAPVSVSTAASVVSAEASLSASQSLASSFVAPADAVRTGEGVNADGKHYEEYALATSPDANQEESTTDTTANPNAVAQAVAEAAKNAETHTVPTVITSLAMQSKGTVAVANITHSAETSATFEYTGSAEVTPQFTHTGNIASMSGKTADEIADAAYALIGKKGTPEERAAFIKTNTASENYFTGQMNTYDSLVAKAESQTGAQKAATLSSASSIYVAIKNYFPATSSYYDAPKSVSNAVSYANSAAGETLIDPGTEAQIEWRALTPEISNEAGTLSYWKQLDTRNNFTIDGGYKIVQFKYTGGTILPEILNPGGQAVGIVLAPVNPNLMGTKEANLKNNLNKNDAIADMSNAIMAGRDLYVNNGDDVNSSYVHIRQTNGSGALGQPIVDSTATAIKVGDNAYAPVKNSGQTTVKNDSKGNPTTVNADADNEAISTASVITNTLSKGVYFELTWNVIKVNDNHTVTGKMVYTEYSDFAHATEPLSRVEGDAVTIQDAMSVGLYGANGGNALTFYGGISHFKGTNAVASVPVHYQVNGESIADDTHITALVGEQLQISDGKNDANFDTSKGNLYTAPTIDGFKVDTSSVLSAIAGSKDGLTINYVADNEIFLNRLQQVEDQVKILNDANTAVQNLIADNKDATGMDKIQKSIEDSVKTATELVTQLKDSVKHVTGTNGDEGDNPITPTITGGTELKNAMVALMNGLSSVTAMATDAKNQQALAEVTASVSDDPTVASNRQALIDAALNGEDTTEIQGKFNTAVKNADAQRQVAVNNADTVLGTKTNWLTFQNDSQAVKDAQKKLDDLVKSDLSTRTQINSANTELVTALTTMPENIIDDKAVNDNADALKTALESGDQAKINTALTNLNTAVEDARGKLNDAKEAAPTAVPANVADQYKDLPEDAKTALNDALNKLVDLKDPKNDATTKLSDIKAQEAIIDGILSGLKTKLDEAKTNAPTTVEATVPANVADQYKDVSGDDKAKLDGALTKLADLKDPKNDATTTLGDSKAQEAIIDGILSGLKAKLDEAKTNAPTTVEAAVPANVADQYKDVSEDAKTALNGALNKLVDLKDPKNNATTTLGDIKAQEDIIDSILTGLKTKLDDAKTGAKVDAAAWDEISSLYADQTAETSAIQKDIDTLTGLTTDDNATKKQIDAARKQLQDDIDVVKGVRNDAVTDGKNTADANKNNKDPEVETTVGKLNDALDNGTASDIKTAIENVKTAVDTVVVPNISDSNDVAKAKDALNAALNTEKVNKAAVQNAVNNFNTAVAKAKQDLKDMKDGATGDEKSWTADAPKYADQKTTAIQNDIDNLKELTENDKSTKKDIDAARKQLQDDIKTVAGVRNAAVKTADDANTAVVNGDNVDVKNYQAAVDNAVKTGTASDIAKAVAKLQTADATVVPTNIADDGDVTVAKTAVDKALNDNDYKQADVDTAKQAYDKAVATAQATLKQAVTDANVVKVPANLQDQVEMAKKNKLGDVNQQVTDLHKAAGQDDTTASTLRSAMTDIQGSLDDMTTKLNTTRDAAQKLVDQTADATDTNVVAARKQVTNLLTNNDTTTMTDLQNAMNVLTATSKPATANTVETSSATVESDQVSTPVANGDAAFAIVTDANGKQTVVQLDKTENGTATANVPGATDAQVVTVPKNGNKPFIFVTDGSGTAQYTELTPNGVKTTITPDGTSTKTTDGKTLDVPADGDVTVMYLPTAEVSVQAGAKNVQVPGKTGYTATVTDAQGNEVTLTDGMIAVDGVPAGTNYLVTYTPDPAKVVVKLGTDSGFAKGEEPAAGNTNAQTLMTVQDALNKLQKDDATLAAIVSTGYTDTKVNVTNAVEALNRVDQNLNIDGYAHRIQAPDGTQYASLEDAVKANPTFAAGTTQMKVVYAPLDGQKIQVKDADGNVLGTVMGKSDAEINVDDFKSVDADLQAKAEKGKLKMTVTAPDGKTYDSLMDALQATGYFDHVGLEDGPSSFDQSDAKFVATAWDETGKATAGYMVLGEPATLNDLNIQDFVVSFAPANDGAGHNNTNVGSKTGSSVVANNQNGDQVNVAGPANESRDGSEVNNATVAGQTVGAQVAGSQTDATANTAQNAGWQAQGATQNSDNTASLLATAGNEQQAKMANSDDARITEMPDSAAVIQDSILPLESAKQAMNLTGRVTEDNFLVVVAAMVTSGLFGLLLAFWRRRKEDDQATR